MQRSSIWSLFVILGLSCIVAQVVPQSPFNDQIYVGQATATSRTSGLSATSLNQPGSVSVLRDSLIVADNNNNRILAYNNLKCLSTFSQPASSVFNLSDFNTKGSIGTAGVEAYSDPFNDNESYIWVGTIGNKTRATVDSVSRFRFPFTGSNQLPESPAFSNISFSTVQAVETDLKNNLLYAIDTGNNRILQYNASNLSSPLRIYGQPSINSTRSNSGIAPNARTLFFPTKVVLGCNNDLFIVDSLNHRVLRYNNNNTTANAVIGQPSFTSTGAGSSAQKLNTPFSAVVNSDCTSLWVADSFNNRVLKYDIRSGLGSVGPTPVGQIGDGSSTPGATRFRPNDIDLEQRTGRLWIADTGNNRVVGGINCGADEYVVNVPINVGVCQGEWNVCGVCDANKFRSDK